MARAKPTVELKDLDQVDALLAELAAINRDVVIAEAAMNEQIDLAKETCKQACEPLFARKKELEGKVTAYCLFHKPELFAKRRSCELPHGLIGFRQSTAIAAIKGLTQADVLAKVQALAMDEALTEAERDQFARGVRVKTDLAKDELLAWPDERLVKVGACKNVKDTFFYEIKAETVEAAA